VERAPLIEVGGVSLRFVNYADKQYSLKRAVLDLVLRRESAVPTSEFWALSDVTFQIREGERVGIVGGNGAGKSTLLRLLARIYPPTKGSLVIRGNIAPLIEMGAGFNAELSGTDNIVLNGAMLGFSRPEMLERMDAIHEFTGLRQFAEMPLKYYSSGMYMRLAFAIATEVNPDILLVDESLEVGDTSFQAKAKDRIRTLLDRSKVVILVSHNLKSLCELCTRGLWIERGRLVGDGPIEDIVERYVQSADRH
jgi:ABC-type polysaccharide/polyol phosphate transport system ATPase subunit